MDVSVPPKPEEVPTAVTGGIAYIEGYNVNLRKEDTSYSVIHQLNKPEAYQVWGEKDGWLNLGGDQWVKYNPAYIRFEKQESVNPIVGKRVVAKWIAYVSIILHHGRIAL